MWIDEVLIGIYMQTFAISAPCAIIAPGCYNVYNRWFMGDVDGI